MTDTADLCRLDATEQARLVRSGEVSARELVDASIARIEAIDPQLNAIIHRRFERARREADTCQGGVPFAGVPMVLKDLIAEMAGEPFHEGMAFLAELGHTPDQDQALTRRFREAGFIVVGKSNTPELGGVPTTEPLVYGPTRNPWDRSRTPGGSSGGSAAAVATGMVAVGHANDAGGSIRNPAARCGLVGLKPSRGRVSQGPLYGDIMGGVVSELAVTRTVRDTAGVLAAVHGAEAGDPVTPPPPAGGFLEALSWRPSGLRVGVWTGIPGGFGELSPEARDAVAVAARLLGELGHHVEEAHPAVLESKSAPAALGRIVMAATAWAVQRWERLTGTAVAPHQLEPITRAYLARAADTSGADLLALMETGQLVTRDVARWFESGHDLLLMATVAEPPNPLGELQAGTDEEVAGALRAVLPSLSLTSWVNLTGLPAISLPLHWTASGLPMGSQLVAPYGREDLLLSVAAALEEAAPWHHRYDELVR